jgi:signal transduction histidine kinase
MKATRRKGRSRPPRSERPSRVPAWMRDRRVVMVIILAVLAGTLYAVAVPVQAVVYGSPVAITMLLCALAIGAPLVSNRYPTMSIAVFTGAALLIPLTVTRGASIDAPWPWSVPLLLAFAVMVSAVTIQHGWRRGLVSFAFGTAAGMTAAIMQPNLSSGNSLIVTTSVVGGIYLVAVLFAGRLRLGDELTRQRAHTAEEQSRRELVEERTRIARELHDVVAHSMSLIQVQASTARYRVAELSPEAIAEFDDIAATARGSLTEMRRILGILRTDDHTADLTPQRGVDDIPTLIETIRRAGADVALSMAVSGDVSPATQIAAYRIAQEAMSNAVRHAPGHPITVSLAADDTALTLTVRNPLPSMATTAPGGHGLRGMTERAVLLGGTVDTGPDHTGSWVVTASIPRHPPLMPKKGPA